MFLVLNRLYKSMFEEWMLLSIVCVILIVTTTATTALPSWNMHYVCGQTISTMDRGGRLILDADLLPSGHLTDCRVVIQPARTESSSTSGNYVLFYFSDFEVGKYCQDTYINVHDGNGINMKPIEGIKLPMCGVNSSLSKNMTFRTQSSSLTVVFQRRVSGLNFRSKFNLTFFSFSEGSCDAEEKSLLSCKNNRCVDKRFTCLDLNPCGDNSDCTTAEEELITQWMALLDKIKIAVIVFFVMLVVICFIKYGKRAKHEASECWECLSDCFGAFSECVVAICRRLNTNDTQGGQEHVRRPRYNSDSRDYDPEHQSSYFDDGPDVLQLGRLRRDRDVTDPDPFRSSTMDILDDFERELFESRENLRGRCGRNVFLRNRSLSLQASEELSITDSPPREHYLRRNNNAISSPTRDFVRSNSESIIIRPGQESITSNRSEQFLRPGQPARANYTSNISEIEDDDFSVSDSDRSYSESETGNQADAPPSYSEIEPSATSGLPAAPPPSYDEVIANVAKFDKK